MIALNLTNGQVIALYTCLNRLTNINDSVLAIDDFAVLSSFVKDLKRVLLSAMDSKNPEFKCPEKESINSCKRKNIKI